MGFILFIISAIRNKNTKKQRDEYAVFHKTKVFMQNFLHYSIRLTPKIHSRQFPIQGYLLNEDV